MPSDIDTAYDYAAQLLVACNAALAGTYRGVITRAYVSPGLPALDCETLAVTLVNGTFAPGPGRASLSSGINRARVNLIGFLVTIARDCIPVIGGNSTLPPTVTDLSAAAAAIYEDVWAVWDHLYDETVAGNLFEGKCSQIYLDNFAALATSGQIAGFSINLRTEIGGIP